MRNVITKSVLVLPLGLLLLVLPNLNGVRAQDAESESSLEEVVVTGSRIRKNPLNEPAPVMDISELDLDRTGLTNLGAQLQQLPITGSAINTKFNVPGNSGFPQDGNGIGAGAVEVSLRNLGAKRTLILVDGKRWIAGASASGVPSSVDLNSIPANVIQRIEILQDGASAIYGSDAIGGVINVITQHDYDGFKIEAQTGQYLSEEDGESTDLSLLWGGGNDDTHFVFSASYDEEKGVETASRAQSAFPSPFGTSCLDGGCSSFTPQARFVLGPNFNFLDITLNDGVLNDGGANIPVFDPNDPNGGADFHAFSSADRFNFNGPGFNFLQTPNERRNIYGDVDHKLTENIHLTFKASYTNRKSNTKAAPEPLCLGEGCGSRITEDIFISKDNPFNPFGVDLSQANGNLNFFGRRPLESGPRRFFQDVDTYFVSAGLEGEFNVADRAFYWDVTGSYGENKGFQQKFGAHNAAKLQVALGDPAVCAATPNCVPFNFFGGQGPDGNGSITQEMLDFVGFVQRDFSEQTLYDFSANLSGSIFELPAGALGFAAGVEYREHDGSFQPDPVAASGETAGIPSGATAGGFDVTEYYGELSIPVLADVTGAQYLEFNLAGRISDYNISGSESTYKIGALWQPVQDISLRGSISTGIRAPGIGELFGGAAREDFTFLDPCADVLGQFGTSNGGRDSAQPQNIIDNCAALGISTDFLQRNPQLSAVSAGNENLIPETSDSISVGFVYSAGWVDNASWVDGLTFSVDYFDIEIDDAVQGRDAGDIITACVETLDPFFCDAVERGSAGAINLVDNQLQNIGGIETSGLDLALRYLGPTSNIGSFMFSVNATYLEDYTELTANPDGSVNVNDLTGTITDETFQRAFPDWRVMTKVDWLLNSWGAGVTFRYVDSMVQPSGNTLDSKLFTDVQLRYNLGLGDDRLSITLGANNVFDVDPAVCDSCGPVNMSPVVHDLPGTVGYIRLSYEM
jgi:iron complex outermembrane receptor protein